MFNTIPRCARLPFVLAGTWFVLALCGAAHGANPNSREPMLPLEIHNLTETQETLNRADNLFQSLFKDLRAIGSNPTRVTGKKLSDLHVQLCQLRRAAVDLQLLGETAGMDYGLRANVLTSMFSKLVPIFQSTPAGQAYVAKAQQYLGSPRASQERQATAANVQKLLQQEKIEEAFKLYCQALDPLSSLTLFLEPRLADLYRVEYAPLNVLAHRRNTIARENAQASLQQLAASQLPRTQELLQAVEAAAVALRTAPQADVDGQSLAGPECLAHFGDVWRQLQLSAVRCRAIEWARLSGIPDLSYLPRNDPQQIQLTDSSITEFYDQLCRSLAGLIEADAQRAAEVDVPNLYVHYLQTLAPLVADTADDKLQTAVQPALEKLANKSAAFADEVQAYRTATHELLRWRARLAQKQAASAAAEFQPSENVLLESFKSEGEFHGLFAANETLAQRAALLMASCPQMIPAVSERILDKPILVENLAGLTGGKLAVARYRTRHYATLPLPDTSPERIRLQQELMATAQQPALTLEAAMAMDSARRGDYVAAGGALKNFYLEGLIPRFATLRPEIRQLVPLGPLPIEVEPLAFISHVLVRFDVQPAWIQHRYFFTSVPQPEAP
jgi:hypothetical protein